MIAASLIIPLVLVAAAPAQPVRAELKAASEPKAPKTEKARPTKAKDAGRALRRAYQKEFAFLDAQRRELERLLEKAGHDLEKIETKAETEENALERELLARRMQADDVARALETVERDAETTTDENPAQSVLDQVAETLGRPELAKAEDSASALEPALLAAVGALEHRSRVREAKGAFFDDAGKRMEGRIVHVGEVAAFGVSDDAAGALLPAGGGALKMMPSADDATEQAKTARALVAGETSKGVGLFLFETVDKAIEQRAEKSALDVVRSGGSIAWVIVALGALALVLMVSRAALLAFLGRGRHELLDRVRGAVHAGALTEAIAFCRGSAGAMAPVLVAALSTLNGPRIAHEDAIDEAMLRQSARVDRFSTLILVAAAVAPLLGLLGTVTGMIATFDTITEFGTGDPRMLSGGISEALVTTELGLIVAIPSLLVGNLLAGWGERIKRDLDTGALSLANAHAEREVVVDDA